MSQNDPNVTGQYDKLLYPAEVAEIFRVSAKSVQRWSREGLLPCVLTPGGHRRYRESDVRRLWESAKR